LRASVVSVEIPAGIEMNENDQQLAARGLTAIRRSLPRHEWERFADTIASDRRDRERHLRKAPDDVDRGMFDMLEQFRNDGIIKLPIALPADTVKSIVDHLDVHPVHRGPHMFSFDGRPTTLIKARADFSMAGYRPDQFLRAPGLVDSLNDPRIVDFIEAYLGCVPTLYSVNGWRSFPAQRPEMVNVQHFHRDDDDWRFCALFIYLWDVDSRAGPHQVIAGSHTLVGMERLIEQARAQGQDVSQFDPAKSFVDSFGEEFSANCERLFGNAVVNATGAAGSMFLVNTIALHRGLVPTHSPRLMIWARYGFGPNTNSADLEQGPLAKRQVPTGLADTPRNRYVNRLLFEFDRGPDY
jgi:hypothetical protein